jgi:hypothetical protein
MKILHKQKGFIETMVISVAFLGFFASAGLFALNTAKIKPRDKKRLSDTNQMVSAINLYIHDKGFSPKNFSDLTPVYIKSLPKAPLPPDGKCNIENNNYRYTKIGDTAFKISFCLGAENGNITQGEHEITENGLR